MGELASHLGVHRQSVQYWLRKRWIPAHRDYRGWPVFTKEDVEKIKQWRQQIVTSPSARHVAHLMDPLVEKEEGARDLYWLFSQRFRLIEEVGKFFEEMAHEESTHAAVVRLLSELIPKSKDIESLRKVVPLQEMKKMMTAINRYKRLAPKASLREAFRMAVDVETMEKHCWPEGMIRALERALPEIFEHLPKYLVAGEENHIRMVDSYAKRYGGK